MGRFQVKCSMGRMECQRVIYLFIYLSIFIYLIYLVTDRVSRGFKHVFVIFRLFQNNYFEFTVLCWNTCLVNVGRDLRAVKPSSFRRKGFSENEPQILPRFPAEFFPYWYFFLASVLIREPHIWQCPCSLAVYANIQSYFFIDGFHCDVIKL